jgi:cytochrome c oxidase subunit 1
MGRVAFALFLVFSMPIGIHHLFADALVVAGFKFVHAVFTAMVSVPTLLTVFTICASVEIAARLRGGRGAFGWVKALPWDNPYMLAVAFAFVMLGVGGAGGIINMSYQLNETIHNTQWVTGHFHLIFAGAIVIMYFVVAYDLWPQLLRCGPLPQRLMKWQLWLWFVGMMVTTLPWHFVGLLGMPRRMAYFDYSHPALQPQAITVTISAIGGLMLVVSGLMFVWILAAAHRNAQALEPRPYTFSIPLHVQPVPAALNGFTLWIALMIGLTVVNYGFPIAQLASLPQTSVPVVRVGGPR